MTDTETTAPAKYRFLGTTDECTECERCHKVELKSTVMLIALDEDGNEEGLVYFGSSCAARSLGRTGSGAARKVLDEARAAHRRVTAAGREAREMLAHYGIPETGDITPKTLNGAAREYRWNHRHGTWAAEVTWDGWKARVLDMVDRKRAALADYALLTTGEVSS